MVRYGQITCKSSISDQKYCFSFILDWIRAVLTNVLQIQSVSVFLLECILHGPTPLGKTQITRQRFDRSQNQDQIWVEDWKPPIYHQKYCFSSSMSWTGAVFVNMPQIQSCTIVCSGRRAFCILRHCSGKLRLLASRLTSAQSCAESSSFI